MTDNMKTELDNLTERASHMDTMRFTKEDGDRLAYLEMAAEIYRLERAAL